MKRIFIVLFLLIFSLPALAGSDQATEQPPQGIKEFLQHEFMADFSQPGPMSPVNESVVHRKKPGKRKKRKKRKPEQCNTIGFWKNHSWDGAVITINELVVDETLGRGDRPARRPRNGILWRASSRNYSMLFAQLTAAKLNCGNTDCTPDGSIILAEQFIADSNASYDSRFQSRQERRLASMFADLLSAFNNSHLCGDRFTCLPDTFFFKARNVINPEGTVLDEVGDLVFRFQNSGGQPAFGAPINNPDPNSNPPFDRVGFRYLAFIAFRPQDRYLYGVYLEGWEDGIDDNQQNNLLPHRLVRINNRGVATDLGPIDGLPTQYFNNASYPAGGFLNDGRLYMAYFYTDASLELQPAWYAVDVDGGSPFQATKMTAQPQPFTDRAIFGWPGDFAADPVSGRVFGTAILADFIFSSQPDGSDFTIYPIRGIAGESLEAITGSIFFDDSGDLYVFGGTRPAQGNASPPYPNQDTLYRVQFEGDGTVTLLDPAVGPQGNSTDGGSCASPQTLP